MARRATRTPRLLGQGVHSEPVGASLSRSPREVGRAIQVPNTRAFSADTALLLAAYFKTTAEFWMNLQARDDLEVARDARSTKAIAKIGPYKAA